MKKIITLLLTLLLLASCAALPAELSYQLTSSDLIFESSSSPVSLSSTSSSTPSSSSVLSPSVNENPIWDPVLDAKMEQILGVPLPYLAQFGVNYEYATGYISQSTIPYINPYIKNAADWTSAYASILLSSGYLFDYSELDEEQVLQHYYHLPLGAGAVIVFFSHYYNQGASWFDIYAYFEGERGDEIPVPTVCDITFTADAFNKKYGKDVKISQQNVTLTMTDVMRENGMIQLKNKTGVITSNAISNLRYLYLSGLDYIDRIEVLKGNSLSALTVVTSYNLVYDVSDATYFRLRSTSNGVVRLESLGIVLS